MTNPHMIGLSYEITPLNFSDTITIRSSLDGNIINDGVARYRQLNQQHLVPIEQGGEGDTSFLVMKTSQSDIRIALAAKHFVSSVNSNINPVFKSCIDASSVATEFEIDAQQNSSVKIRKLVSIYTSQKWDCENPRTDAINDLNSGDKYELLKSESAEVWKKIWDKIDIQIEGDRLAQKLLRMHLYHLMVSFSPNNKNYDASVTARGLHGEAYRGHIFWDEIFILPLYNIHFPEVAKSALMYRFNRLDAARSYAKEHGYEGAMFPWQSGSDGREETQVVHLNPVTGRWGPDFSSFQRHVSLAIAYNVWQYFHVTNDVEFMEKYGAEMFFEICRFWASKAIIADKSGRYSVKNVMGPDEFHEKYPGTDEGGLKDNTYTNLMVVWSFRKANQILNKISAKAKLKIFNNIQITDNEILKWNDIASKMNIVIEDNILAQYEGYFDLEELDWQYYREKYENIYRMDRILKSEGKSADNYKVAKQADTLQTFYNLEEQDVTEMLENLGYKLSGDYLSENLKYFLKRTSHGSTLSRVVHAQLANMINNKKLSCDLYKDALTSDYADVQGGTTGEGIHAGVMAGTVLIAFQSFAGLNLKSDIVKINPHLPDHWRSISFKFGFKNVQFNCFVNQNHIRIKQSNQEEKKINIYVNEKAITLSPDSEIEIKY